MGKDSLKIIASCVLILYAGSSLADRGVIDHARVRCSAPVTEKPLYQPDVIAKKYMSRKQLAHLGEKVYGLRQRFPNPFYFSQVDNSFVFVGKKKVKVKIPNDFILSVLNHLKVANEKSWVESFYYSDLGHGHFHIPKEFYKKTIEPLPSGSSGQIYNLILNHPDLKIIYHSAEQLKKTNEDRKRTEDPQDRFVIDRRNIVGDFSVNANIDYLPPKNDINNTQSRLEGYRGYYSMSLSWNKNGCFLVNSKKGSFYVDLSFDTLDPDPRVKKQKSKKIRFK